MPTHSPYKPKKTFRRSKPIYPNMFDLYGLYVMWDWYRKSSRLDFHEERTLRLLFLAGALQIGPHAFLTVCLHQRDAIRVIQNIRERVMRADPDWNADYVAVDVPAGFNLKGEWVQDHVHLILFGAGPGTPAYRTLEKIVAEECAGDDPDSGYQTADLREADNLPKLAGYFFDRNVWRDFGRFFASKPVRKVAEEISGMTEIKVWRRMRDALSPEVRCGWDMTPPYLANPATCAIVAPVPKQNRTLRDVRNRKRAIIVAGESEDAPAGTLPAATVTALSEARERDFESLAVGTPGEGAFDLLDETAGGDSFGAHLGRLARYQLI